MNKIELRKEFGYGEKDFILLYIAEFIPRKNHDFLFHVIKEVKKNIPNLTLLLAGKGEKLKEMKHLAIDLEIDDIVKFLGYRSDINNLCRISDVYVATSHQEGLPISVIEAMATGLPIVASNIRGQSDVIKDGVNGFLFPIGDEESFIYGIEKLYNDFDLREKIRINNLRDSKKFSVDVAVDKMKKIYENELK